MTFYSSRTDNRFHDPHEKSSELAHLREAMDRVVLEAYSWDDLAASARCEFLLDYEEKDELRSHRSEVSKSNKKKPWRLRWRDDFRDEVLARLLELNEQRHQEELLSGGSIVSRPKENNAKPTNFKNPGNRPKRGQQDLFNDAPET